MKTRDDAVVITCVSVIDVANGYGACSQVVAKRSTDSHAVGYVVKHLEHAGLTGEDHFADGLREFHQGFGASSGR